MERPPTSGQPVAAHAKAMELLNFRRIRVGQPIDGARGSSVPAHAGFQRARTVLRTLSACSQPARDAQSADTWRPIAGPGPSLASRGTNARHIG